MTGLDLGINLDDFTRLRDALQRAGLPEQSIRECQAAARMDAAAYAQHPRSAQTLAGSSQPAPTTTNAAALWDASLSRVLPQVEAEGNPKAGTASADWQASLARLRAAGDL